MPSRRLAVVCLLLLSIVVTLQLPLTGVAGPDTPSNKPGSSPSQTATSPHTEPQHTAATPNNSSSPASVSPRPAPATNESKAPLRKTNGPPAARELGKNESDRVPQHCKHEPCATCPPGQSPASNGKCFAARSATNSLQCLQDGLTCTPVHRCRPGEYWNGFACENSAECANFENRAALLANEARGIKGQIQTACAQNPLAQSCLDLTQRHEETVLLYRSLLNEAPAACRILLPDPLTL